MLLNTLIRKHMYSYISENNFVLCNQIIIPTGYSLKLICQRIFRALYFNPLALELGIYSLAHNLCKMLIFYEPRRVTLGNTRHFVEE